MTNSKNELYVDHENIDWTVLESYLKENISDVAPDQSLIVEKFTEGYSNLTYLVKIGEWEAILRRPPFGKIPPRAHDMQREYNILEKINPVFPLAPKPYLYSEDEKIMDKHFYVMEKKQGLVIDDTIPSSYGESTKVGPLISKSVIKTLSRLQSIDYKTAGLEGFGKPEGYLERQVNGWIRRYKQSKTDSYTIINELEEWFLKNYPLNNETTIVHNDFKLNNLIFDKDNIGEIIGVLDWELSTVGDPLTDVGSTVAYWGQPEDPDMGINIVTNQQGFYSRREFIEEYSLYSGRDMSDIKFYVSFGFYKLAVILQQIYYRWKIGELKDDRFGDLNKAISNLFEMADLTRKNKLF